MADAPVEDTLRLPVPSPIPVLFFHGDWDTSTPIDNTLGMLPYFPNGHGGRLLAMGLSR